MKRAIVAIAIAGCSPIARTPSYWMPARSTPQVARSADGMLGLAEAIDLAARADPRGAAAMARRRVAELRRSDAWLGAAPDVVAGAAYTTGFPGSGSDLQLRGMLGSPFFHHYVVGVDASWNVAELLREPHAVRAADAELDAADGAGAIARREAALVVIDLFERILGAHDTQGVLAAELTSRRQELDALRARVAARSVAEAELLQADAAIADLDADLASARSDERSARAALRVVIADDRALTAMLRFDQIADTGVPEHALANALRREANEQRELARLAWLPRLMLGVSAGYANPAAGSDAGLYAAGAAVAFPLTWAARERAHREAEAATADARALDADATVQQLTIRTAELDGAIAGLESALPAAEASRKAAEQARDAITARAQAGAVAQVEVEAAAIALRRAQMRERTLHVHLDGLRARGSFLTAHVSP